MFEQVDPNTVVIVWDCIREKLRENSLLGKPGIIKVFWALAKKAPRELSLREQINWTVDLCKEVVEAFEEYKIPGSLSLPPS